MVNRDRLDLFDPNELGQDPATRVRYREAVTAQFASILLMEMREAAGLSREQLAQLTGKSRDEIELLERGRSPDGPSMGFVLRVAELCGANLSVSFKNSARPSHVIGGV
jgi:DNA-binding XRE family transcriptional regulator